MFGPIIALISALVTVSFPSAFQTPNRSDQKSDTTLRVTTRLVQASVIVQAKDGRPVTGLTKDDFVLLVGGKERAISAFSEEKATISNAPSDPLPPRVYSNELTRQAGIPGSLTAILFDTLNTRFADQVFSKRQVVEFLGGIQPQDRIAILTLGSNLRLLHDFSNDSSSLVRAIQDYKVRLNTLGNPLKTESSDTGNPVLDDILDKSSQGSAIYYEDMRILRTFSALTNIANYLRSIPGRKNLIWISGSFPFNFKDWDSQQLPRLIRMEDFLNTCRAVSNANMAVYPVDARGLVGLADIVPQRALEMRDPNRSSSALRNFALTQQTMQALADRTGGRAFYNTNDITKSIRQAFDDSAVHYMLGFYPLETEWNSKFHNIEVKVKHSGLEVRHREVFYGLPELRLSAKDRTERALQAVTAPLQATGVTLMVRLAENPSRNAPLRFDLVIDPRQITLESHGSHMTGSLYLAFVQCTVAGKILAAKQEKGDLNLDEATYQKALMNGFALAREWALQPGAEQLRIGVCDGASDNVGSVTIPLFK